MRIWLQIDTAWDATVGVAHAAAFEGLDLGAAGPATVEEAEAALTGLIEVTMLVIMDQGGL